MSDAAFITAKLKKVRGRQFLMLMLHGGCIALLGFMFWVVLCTFNILPLPRLSAIMLMTSGAVLISAVFIISLLRMPSWKETAKRVDQAFGLQQRMETSWECIPPHDEMDALLLRDTSQRIGSILPAAAVPAQFGGTTKRLLLICLLATTALGIARILEGWRRAYSPGAGNTTQNVTGSSPQSKNAQRANPSKNRPSSPGRVQITPSQQHNPEFGRSSQPNESVRASTNIPEQTYMQPVQGLPATSIPDRGSAGRQKELSATLASSDAVIKPESKINAGTGQADTAEGSAEDKSHSRGGRSSSDSGSRPNAGARSIRKSARESAQYAGAPALSRAEANAAMLSGGQTSRSLNKSGSTRNDAAKSSEQSRENPALWFAVEQALQKEGIPPGFKKYIADYFKAIHP